jgi:MFS transporter, DHA1 family, inner membrane transport protein
MRWSVLALMLVVFSLTTGEFVVAGILPEVASDLAVSVPAAGLLVSAYALGMIVGGPVVTVLTARLARKPLMVGLIAVSIVGNLGSVAAPNLPLLLVARFTAGVVVATFFAVALATVAATAAPGRQASTIAKVTVGMNLGLVLGSPIGTVVGQELGWRATFGAIATFTAAALLLVLRFVPAVERAETAASAVTELRVFRSRALQRAIALTAVGNVGLLTVYIYISPLLTEVSGFEAGAVPVLLVVYGVGAVVGNFVGGWLADKAMLSSLVALLAALGAGLALFWMLGDIPVAAAVLTFVLGVLAFAVIPGMQTHVIASAAAAPTLAVAVNASGFQVAAAFAGWLGGRVIDGVGLSWIPLVGALLTLAGLAIAMLVRGRSRDASAPPSRAI